MRGPEHASIAIVTTGGALWLLNGQVDLSAYALTAMSVAAIGSLVPDIDHPQAWISNRIPATLLVGGGVALGMYEYFGWMMSKNDSSDVTGALTAPLMTMMQPFLPLAWLAIVIAVFLLTASIILHRSVEHRGPTHSIAVGLVLTAAVTLGVMIGGASWFLGLWFGWGFGTHLLADMTTKMGCPALLWPLGTGSANRSPAGRTAVVSSPVISSETAPMPGTPDDAIDTRDAV